MNDHAKAVADADLGTIYGALLDATTIDQDTARLAIRLAYMRGYEKALADPSALTRAEAQALTDEAA